MGRLEKGWSTVKRLEKGWGYCIYSLLYLLGSQSSVIFVSPILILFGCRSCNMSTNILRGINIVILHFPIEN